MVHWSANLFTSILSVTNQGDYQIIVKKIKVNNHYIVPQNNPVSIETGESFTEIPYKGPEPVKVEVETDQGIYTQKMGETKYYNN